MKKTLNFYREHGIMTEITTMKHMVKDIPKDVPSIVSIVQNVFLHQHCASLYGVELENKRKEEPWLRSVEEKLTYLNKLGYEHVLDKKQLEDKMIAICRDFSVMAAALCREVGIPARARCGFATYFEKDKYIDHWVLEYWNQDRNCWVKELIHTDKAIIDIGIKYGYQSREAFSRAFEKIYGKNPSEVRQEGLLYSIREPMTFDYMMFEYNRRKNGMQPLFRKLPERLVVGIKHQMKVDESNYQEIPLLWQKWQNDRAWLQIEERKYDDECMGICLFSEGDIFEYMIGHEVKTTNHIPKNMDMYRIEPSFYAVFRTVGPITESIQKTWDYIYTIWLNESPYEHAGTHDIEYYYYHQGELVADLYVPILSYLSS